MSGFDSSMNRMFADMHRQNAIMSESDPVTRNLLLAADFEQSAIRQQQEQERAHRQELERLRIEAENRRLEQERKEREANEKLATFESLMGQGFGYAANKIFDQALDQYERALRLFPNDKMAKFNSAVCLEELNEYKAAYDRFINLAGYSNEIPGYVQHLRHCEDKLVEISTDMYEQAKDAYNSANTDIAKKHLMSSLETAPSNTDAGKNLQTLANQLLLQIEWDKLRGKIVGEFTEGLKFLNQKQFELALTRFNYCSENLKKYSQFIKEGDQENQIIHNLSNVISQANRGAIRLNNISLQNEINLQRAELEALVKDFAIDNAIRVCEDMLKKCEAITDYMDVAGMDCVIPREISETIHQLKEYSHERNARRIEYIQYLKTTKEDAFAIGNIKINQNDSNILDHSLVGVVKNNWINLDSRSLEEITSLLVKAVLQHCLERNFIGKCCAGVSHYLDLDQTNQLFDVLDKIVKDNIPNDTRAPIKIQMLKVTAAENTAPVFFSWNTTGSGGATGFEMAIEAPAGEMQKVATPVLTAVPI